LGIARIALQLWREAVGPLTHRQPNQFLAVAGVAVDGLLRHPGVRRHRFDGGGLVALRQQQFQRGLQHGVADFGFRPRRAAAAAGR